MLTLHVGEGLMWDQKNEVFVHTDPTILHLEHSLRAVSKWESLHEKPFLGKKAKTAGEMLDYIRCMCLDDSVDPAVFYALTKEQLEAVQKYIDLPMSATWFTEHEKKRPSKGEVVTAELVYFWMCSFGIDWQAQDWHFNKLMTLIRVCSEKNKPPKKVPKAEALARQRALNAKRRKKHHTRG